MYSSTSSRHPPMYTANHMSSLATHAVSPSDPYHWDQPMHAAHNQDQMTVNGHSNESLWYSATKRLHNNNQISIDQSNHSVSHKSLNSHQPSLIYSTLHHSAGPRAVIPSKRAAQNRAAQRAFRQRKERYVKDLEKKAKLMDEWKAEMDLLRQQNKELRECNMSLEKQIHQQQQQQSSTTMNQTKLISPIHSPNLAAEVIPAPVVVVMDQPTVKSTRRRIKQEPLAMQDKHQAPFMPVNLRAPDQASFIGSPTTSCSSSSSSSSINGLEDMPLQAPTMYHSSQIPWTTPAPNDFDHPYDANLDFMSGEQALDDLFVILQTRQRPEISHNYVNNSPTAINYAFNERASPMQEHDQADSMMLARSY
ncbi:basic-leucine zipper transcription factor [Mucor lusitanicus]